ncbi:MAG: hypothetical protein MI919_42480, partial [Holophagales bacterium]|nr:hypothetical protein [Holophagales bacterium]
IRLRCPYHQCRLIRPLSCRQRCRRGWRADKKELGHTGREVSDLKVQTHVQSGLGAHIGGVG